MALKLPDNGANDTAEVDRAEVATVGAFGGIVAAEIRSTVTTGTHALDDDALILRVSGDDDAANFWRFALRVADKNEVLVIECGAHAAPLHSKELSPPKSPGNEVSAQRKYLGQETEGVEFK